MKRLWLIILVAAGVTLGLVYFGSFRSKGTFDATKVFSASQSYAHTLRTARSPIPPTVTLRTLIDGGFLRRSDVSSFDGLDVTVSLLGNLSRPQDVLMRVHFPDGNDLVVLVDGSVQQIQK